MAPVEVLLVVVDQRICVCGLMATLGWLGYTLEVQVMTATDWELVLTLVGLQPWAD